jgi:hypothetical protein
MSMTEEQRSVIVGRRETRPHRNRDNGLEETSASRFPRGQVYVGPCCFSPRQLYIQVVTPAAHSQMHTP